MTEEDNDRDSSTLLNSDSEDDEVEDVASKTKKRKKPAGRKSQWNDKEIEDMVDIIIDNDKIKKQLIFQNVKKQKNGKLYGEVQNRLKERHPDFIYGIPQMRTRFKKCISICKQASMTIKTGSGIKRFQDDKGYGSWFNKLFPVVSSRDSCNTDLAVEPSLEDDVDTGESQGAELFVPVPPKKKKKVSKMDQVVDIMKETLADDSTDKLISFFKEELENSRKHEMEMMKMLMKCQEQPAAPQPPPPNNISASYGPGGSTYSQNQHHGEYSSAHYTGPPQSQEQPGAPPPPPPPNNITASYGPGGSTYSQNQHHGENSSANYSGPSYMQL